jgi:hypothetical protein
MRVAGKARIEAGFQQQTMQKQISGASGAIPISRSMLQRRRPKRIAVAYRRGAMAVKKALRAWSQASSLAMQA